MQSSARRRLVGFGIAGLAALSLPAFAQSERRVRRIGYHSAASSQSNSGWLEAFREGMTALGWVDGRDYVIDARYADGVPAAVPRLARELVATQPDLLLAPGDASARALANLTKTIPIVFAVAADPVGNGLAKSLQHPGGNLTGLTSLTHDLAAKRLQLLKEAFPKISHVVFLFEPAEPSGASQLRSTSEAAARLKIRLTPLELRQASDIDAAFSRRNALGADAYVIATGFMVAAERKGVAAAALRAKVSSIGSAVYMAEAGVLMSYSSSPAQLFRRAASYVDKILKGAKPGDLAIEQPTKFELVVNQKTAKAIGVTIPRSIVLRADRVIE
jgi:putative tryptophan/tyrosine transport system substrate-binding protein